MGFTLLVNVYITMKNPPFSMGKLTISMAMFNSYVKLPEGKSSLFPWYRWSNQLEKSCQLNQGFSSHVGYWREFLIIMMRRRRTKRILEVSRKRTKASWAGRDVCRENAWRVLNWNKLPFDVAGTLTAADHDILARMHCNHSTTLPQTS